MFQPKAVRIAAIVAIVLSIIGLLLNIVILFAPQKGFLAFVGLLSWAAMIWASVIGYQLSGYRLYDEEYRKIGIRIYLIIAAFVLFLATGFILGVVLSIILFSSLWGLKQNYNEWDRTDELFDPPAHEN